MKQYEFVNKDFRFIGPSPIDYNTIKNGICVYPELCNMDIKKLKDRVNVRIRARAGRI